MYALIRDIRAHAQNVQMSVAGIRKALTQTDAQSRLAGAATALLEAEFVLPASRHAVSNDFRAVQTIFDDHPTIANYFRDWVVYVQSAWTRAQAAWPSGEINTEDIAAKLDRVEPLLRETVYSCGYITIPSRLRETMASLRVGQSLDFHWAFQEELPTLDDRNRILEFGSCASNGLR
jgi:hypothetical protein